MASSDNEEKYYSSDNEEKYYSSDNEEKYYYTEDDDQSNQSACEDVDDNESGCSDGDYTDDDRDDESAQAEEAEDDAPEECEQRYMVVTEGDVRARQDDDTARVAQLLSIPSGFAAVLLRHYGWSVKKLEDEWFLEDQRVRDDVGLPVDCVPTVLNDRPLTCAICFDPYSPGEMRSAGCSHYYCHGCWRSYIREAVGDGPRCLSLRCPDPCCQVAVVREFVDEVADDEDRERYAMFTLRSYLEESKKIRWCPGPGCTLAAELLCGEKCMEPLDVFCECKHSFCFRCGEEAHRPLSCETVRKWLIKHRSESETMNWVLTNTKHCPKCRQPIEKNQGCMHMTCRPPCCHEFCWLCLGAWDEHRGNDYFRCESYEKAKAKGTLTDEEVRREQAKASLDKYLHYYERWTANGKSRQEALKDMNQLQSGGLDWLSAAVGVKVDDFDFLTEAYERIADCRRVLRWVYAYGYFLEPERDKLKHELLELVKSDAEGWLERLHHCAENERRMLWEEEDGAERYRAYKVKLKTLTAMTGTRFRQLVKAFEGDLAEVKPVVDLPIRRPVVCGENRKDTLQEWNS